VRNKEEEQNGKYYETIAKSSSRGKSGSQDVVQRGGKEYDNNHDNNCDDRQDGTEGKAEKRNADEEGDGDAS
jgi:hypothetical protein